LLNIFYLFLEKTQSLHLDAFTECTRLGVCNTPQPLKTGLQPTADRHMLQLTPPNYLGPTCQSHKHTGHQNPPESRYRKRVKDVKKGKIGPLSLRRESMALRTAGLESEPPRAIGALNAALPQIAA
jgi:hypothetical protein